MRKFILLILLIFTFLLAGCQQNTKQYGGTTTIDIPAGKRLVPYTVQWESSSHDIWYLIEDAPVDYQPKTYEFKESSNFGAMEGEVIFVEHKAGDIVPNKIQKKNETIEQANKILRGDSQ